MLDEMAEKLLHGGVDLVRCTLPRALKSGQAGPTTRNFTSILNACKLAAVAGLLDALLRPRLAAVGLMEVLLKVRAACAAC